MHWSNAIVVLILVPSPALAGKANSPIVTVVDVNGNPIPTAVVVHDSEGERHDVHGRTGTWTSSGLYLPGGVYVPLEKGGTMTLVAGAPGYAPARSTTVIRKKKVAVGVTLERIPEMAFDCLDDGVDLDSDAAITWASERLAAEEVEDAACVHGVHAVAAHRGWIQASSARIADPSRDTNAAEEEARSTAHTAAAEWLQAEPESDHAALLCQATAYDLAPCR